MSLLEAHDFSDQPDEKQIAILAVLGEQLAFPQVALKIAHPAFGQVGVVEQQKMVVVAQSYLQTAEAQVKGTVVVRDLLEQH